MCILFIHTNPEPQDNEYRFIVASNRDVYLQRPTKAAYRCPRTDVIAGRDMEPGKEGGSWLGFRTKNHPENTDSTKHCFSCLTSLAGDKVENAMGRGRLVVDYLEGDMDYPEYVSNMRRKGFVYNGYNLIAVEISKGGNTTTYHHSNRPQIDSVYTGKHTLSFEHTAISAPNTKMIHGKEKFQDIIENGLKKEQLIDELVAFLKDKTRYLPDNELKKKSSNSAEKLSSIFVEIPEAGYGTRIHTIILIDKNWNLDFKEISREQPIDFTNQKWRTTLITSQL